MSKPVEISAVQSTQVAVLVDKRFLDELGVRISERRRALGLTQTDVADVLGCSQPMMASYEAGRRRLPVSFLPPLAKVLRTTTTELLGESASKTAKRGPKSKLELALLRAKDLSKKDQEAVIDLIDALETRKRAKRRKAS